MPIRTTMVAFASMGMRMGEENTIQPGAGISLNQVTDGFREQITPASVT